MVLPSPILARKDFGSNGGLRLVAIAGGLARSIAPRLLKVLGAPPGATDSLGARKAKAVHQVNQVVAQSKIRRHPVDRFYARHFDLRQRNCRRFGRPLLRMCCKRPCRRAAEERYERAPFHSITSSARASSMGGISRPKAFAVARLIVSSNFVGRSTGSSSGLAPFRI